MKLFLLFLVFLLFSCKKDRLCQTCFKDAIIINDGLVEGGGCGLVVKFIDSGQLYHPDILPEGFRKSDLHIKICYEVTTDKFNCGISGTGLPVIHVVDIKRK